MKQTTIEENILPLSNKRVKKETKKIEPKRKFVKWKALIAILIALAILYGISILAISYNKWSQTHEWQKPYVFSFNVRPVVKKIEPKEVLSPISVEAINPLPKDLDSIEQKICNRWGVYECKTAIAVFRCESGLRPEEVNWDSKDVGIAQINWPIWEKPVKEKFGYTLKDMFDADKNLDVALWIYDRDGNGAGSYEPWVAFNTGKFKTCMK